MKDKFTTKELQEEQKGKYPFFDESILNWLEFRIDKYLTTNADRI